MTSSYPVGKYVKGGRTKFADTAADAVALAFDGFRHVPEVGEPEAEQVYIVEPADEALDPDFDVDYFELDDDKSDTIKF